MDGKALLLKSTAGRRSGERPMRVLITGAFGQVGWALTSELRRHKVIAINRKVIDLHPDGATLAGRGEFGL